MTMLDLCIDKHTPETCTINDDRLKSDQAHSYRRFQFYCDEVGGVFSSLPSVFSEFEVETELNVRAKSCGLDLEGQLIK